MGNWGVDSVLGNVTSPDTLQQIIEEFPSGLKQAMFAAASRDTIRRGTWNGCAMNAAGFQVGKLGSVSSVQTAAKAFNVTPAQVTVFIRCWDSLEGTDEECTQTLREMLEKAGLFTEPGRKLPRIIRVKVYEQQEKKLREQFDVLVQADLIPNTEVAHDILVGATAS